MLWVLEIAILANLRKLTRDLTRLRNSSKLVVGLIFAVIDLLLWAKSITLYFIWHVGDELHKQCQIKKKLHVFSCYYCAIVLKRKSEHWGPRPDTSSLVSIYEQDVSWVHFVLFCISPRMNSLRHVQPPRPGASSFIVPTFDTKVTEYLCSGWFFFLQTSFDFLTSHFWRNFFKSVKRYCCLELKFERIFHLWSFFVKLWGFRDCHFDHFDQFGTINARYNSPFILFHLIFSCYYCSINLKRQSEHSGLRPDTSSFVCFEI